MIATTSQTNPNLDAQRGCAAKTVHHDIVIVGGGTGGITVAAQLTKGLFNNLDVTIVDPSSKHYNQPAWTLVGARTYRKDATERDEASVIPIVLEGNAERQSVIREQPTTS